MTIRTTECLRFIVPNEVGLHARPAALLVRVAQTFHADIRVECQGRTGDAKSMMGVLLLGAEQGMEVTVTANGEDGAEALRAIAELVAHSFDEASAPAPYMEKASGGPEALPVSGG